MNVFASSVDSLVVVFEVFVLVIVAVFPYFAIGALLFIPSRYLYIRTMKPKRLEKKLVRAAKEREREIYMEDLLKKKKNQEL